MRISGADFKAWYDGAFPPGYALETGACDIHDRDGNWIILDTDVVDTNQVGALYWDGDPDMNPHPRGYSVTKAFRDWKRNQDNDRIVIEVPQSRILEIHAALEHLGVKIISS